VVLDCRRRSDRAAEIGSLTTALQQLGSFYNSASPPPALPLRFPVLAMLEPNARAFGVVRLKELHPRLLQGRLNLPQTFCGASYLSGTFETPYRSHVHGRALGQIRLAYV